MSLFKSELQAILCPRLAVARPVTGSRMAWFPACFVLAISLLATTLPVSAQCTDAWVPGIGSPGVASPQNIFAMAILPGGDVVAGGDFTAVGGTSLSYLARFNPSTTGWSAIGPGLNGSVLALATSAGGDVFAGGSFTTLGSRIVRFNPTTGTGSTLGAGTNNTVRAIAVLPNGNLIVGGDFTQAGGVSASFVAGYNVTSGAWSGLGAGANSTVNALAVLPNGDVILGGDFTSAGSLPLNRIARYNPTSGIWTGLQTGTNGDVTCLAVLPGGDVLVGGNFTSAGGVAANRIARYSPSTNSWAALGAGMNSSVLALTVLPSGNILAGGNFTTAGGVSANRVARYNLSTGVWFAVGTGMDDSVLTLAGLPTGDALAAGTFSTAGGVSSSRVARFVPGGNAPNITVSPAPQPVCQFTNATFSVTASGSGPLTFQWRRNAATINAQTNPSAVTATLLLTNVQPSDVGSYDCVVAQGTCSATSAAAALTIAACGPTLSVQPGPVSTCPGTEAAFSVAALGAGPFTYQWRKGGVAITPAQNATASSATLRLSNVQSADAGSYDCIVTQGLYSTTSQAASLSFSCVPFANAGPTSNASWSDTRPPPGDTGSPVTYAFRSLTLTAGSFFGLGSNETLNLDNCLGTLTIGLGATFVGNGTVCGNIFNAGLCIIPITRAAVISATRGGFVRLLPSATSVPGTPATFNPGTNSQIQPGTYVAYGQSGFGSADTGGGGSSGSRWYSMTTNTFTTSGAAGWDGRLDVTGSFTQTDTGVLRLFIAGPVQGETYSFLNVGQAVSLRGTVQIVLQPELFDYVPNLGATFDFITAAGGITLPPSPETLNVQTLMTAAGAQRLGLSLPAFVSGFAGDPNALVSLPSNLFTFARSLDGRTLRFALSTPVCGPLVGPAPVGTCANGTASFSVTTAGSGPFTIQWQVQAAGSTTWQPMVDGNIGGLGLVSGTTGRTLAISNVDPLGASLSFRCSVSGPCGTAITTPVSLTTDVRCSLADIVGTNGGPTVCGDATVDGADFIAFINSFSVGDPAIDPLADVAGAGPSNEDPDGIIDGTDFIAFINAFAAGC